MTLEEYLCRYGKLYKRRERKFEKYMRLSARATDPRSSLNVSDGIKTRSTENLREAQLINAAAALQEYYKADDEFLEFQRVFDECLRELTLSEQTLLSAIYIKNIHRDYEDRYIGICKLMSIKRAEIPPREAVARQHLLQILKRRGIEIDDSEEVTEE